MNALTQIESQAPAKRPTSGTAPHKPQFSTCSQAELHEQLSSGALTEAALSRDLAASRRYWVDVASEYEIGAAYRQLKAVKGHGDIREDEVGYIVNTFIRDAQRHNLSQGELEQGMECYRDNGGPFLPRTFGDWKAAQEGHIFLSGQERHDRYMRDARRLQDDKSNRQEPEEFYDLMDLSRRSDNAAKLFHLARRHSARCSYDLRSLPCVIVDLDAQMRRVCVVPADKRTQQEREAIGFAERVSRFKRKGVKA